MPDSTSITALLGPTNTGKTHRAVERMLEHPTGMIGLPLRLLAREIYDRITAKIGEARVALVTGEEKRVPRRPDYWVCTVEAMPIEREVDFVCVDEVQLAAHAQRGHVFTDRLLRARGRRETWFLGADTMRSIMPHLVPVARIGQHPRLSRLTFAGEAPLAKTPPRSAVVAFSIQQVYELAERLRATRGGAAVVLGALSPRTRNAQVAMFQAGEVDHLVATDAIGMGLNLDVHHVAFAATRKFDGRDVRELDEAELGQIAGRAGRYVQDGTFGTVSPLTLPVGVVAAIEQHRFPPVRHVQWRSADLDFASIEALETSLRAPPRLRVARLVRDAEDAAALAVLATRDRVRARAKREDAVRLLWDVCTVPDFRRLLFESHVAFLEELFVELSDRGHLEDDWIAPRVAELQNPDGDVDTLVARIAQIRTWTYVSHQARWVQRAEEWQERTRAIEDRLSDALHDRLVARFVDQKAQARAKVARARPRARTVRGDEATRDVTPSHPFAALRAMRDKLANEPAESRAPSGEAHWIDEVIDAPHERFALDESARIVFGERVVGELAAGPSIVLPEVRLVDLDAIGAGARARLLRRLTAFARDEVNELLAPVRDLESLSPAGRGVAYAIEQGLGTALVDASELGEDDRAAFERAGVVVGVRVAYVKRLLRPAAIALRARLATIHYERRVCAVAPAPGRVSFVPSRNVDPRAYVAIGYPIAGPRAVRADVFERVARAPEGTDDATLAQWLGCSPRDARAIASSIVAVP